MSSIKPAAVEPVVYLAATDGTSAGDYVVDVAAKLARNGGATELHLVHVLQMLGNEPLVVGPIPSVTEMMEEGRKTLERLCTEASKSFTGRVVGHLAVGEPWREIVQVASNLRADLVVVGTADRTGIKRMFLGSVAARVVRKAQCPVLVARRKDYHSREIPEIEPACDECLAIQNATHRETLWCARHGQHHIHGRVHYETPSSFGVGSMLVRP